MTVRREVGTRRAEGAVGPTGKAGIEPKPADSDDALPVLGDAEVRGVYLAEVDQVASAEQRLQEVADEEPRPVVRNPSTFSNTNAFGRWSAMIDANARTREFRSSSALRRPAEEKP